MSHKAMLMRYRNVPHSGRNVLPICSTFLVRGCWMEEPLVAGRVLRWVGQREQTAGP